MQENGYVLLMGHTTDELTQEVRRHLKEGWRLSGVHQVAMACQSATGHPAEGAMYYVFTQAMAR